MPSGYDMHNFREAAAPQTFSHLPLLGAEGVDKVPTLFQGFLWNGKDRLKSVWNESEKFELENDSLRNNFVSRSRKRVFKCLCQLCRMASLLTLTKKCPKLSQHRVVNICSNNVPWRVSTVHHHRVASSVMLTRMLTNKSPDVNARHASWCMSNTTLLP